MYTCYNPPLEHLVPHQLSEINVLLVDRRLLNLTALELLLHEFEHFGTFPAIWIERDLNVSAV